MIILMIIDTLAFIFSYLLYFDKIFSWTALRISFARKDNEVFEVAIALSYFYSELSFFIEFSLFWRDMFFFFEKS